MLKFTQEQKQKYINTFYEDDWWIKYFTDKLDKDWYIKYDPFNPTHSTYTDFDYQLIIENEEDRLSEEGVLELGFDLSAYEED